MSIRVNNQVVSSEIKSLWMGEIEPWMDENSIAALFAHIAKTTSVKIIKDRMTGLPAGYGFVEFDTHETAKKVLETLNGTPIPGYNRVFKLNWAVQSGNASKFPLPTTPTFNYSAGGSQSSGDISVYVGDLDPNVTDSVLLDAFNMYYKSIISANVIVDPITKISKKYGFVKFSSSEDAQRAILEMNGKYILSRPIKLNIGFRKSVIGQPPQYPTYGGGFASFGQPTATPTYTQTPYPGYPTYPYKANNQAYGYNYNSADPYNKNAAYSYGGGSAYQYPQSSYCGSYGTPPQSANYSASKYPYSAPAGYPPTSGFPQTPNYPSYNTKNYMDSLPQPGPYAGYSESAMPTSTPSTTYQYQTDYQYTYPAAEVSLPAPEPPKEVKEIDMDLDEENLNVIYTPEEIIFKNKNFFEELLSIYGKISLV